MRFHQRLMASFLAFAAGWLVSVHAQTLDESLLEQHASATQGREPISDEPGLWNVWIEVDLGTLEQFDSNTDPHLLGAMQLGNPGWSNATAIATLGGMNNSVFIDASMNWQSQYVPRPAFVGASVNVWKNLSFGLQGGRAWTPIFVNCRRADGEMVVASVRDLPPETDMIDLFRNSDAVGPIVAEALTALPGLRTVWMQLEIFNADARAAAEAKGIQVIEDRCPKIEYPRLFGDQSLADLQVVGV